MINTRFVNGSSVVVCLILTLVMWGACKVQAANNDYFNEVNQSFTYKGKPMHPFLLGTFENWSSDGSAPIVTVVDVAAAYDTNQYPLDEIKAENGWIGAIQDEDDNQPGFEQFSYKWLGKINDDIHVVEIGNSGGGSGFFMDLYFVKFSKAVINVDEQSHDQILMHIVRKYPLGDRYEGEIKISANKVFIPKGIYPSGEGKVEQDVELSYNGL